jgi:hypothetical protein
MALGGEGLQAIPLLHDNKTGGIYQISIYLPILIEHCLRFGDHV